MGMIYFYHLHFLLWRCVSSFLLLVRIVKIRNLVLMPHLEHSPLWGWSALGIESRTQDLRPWHHDCRCVVTNPWQWKVHKKTRNYWSWKLHDSTVGNESNLVCIRAKRTYGGIGGITLLRPLLNLGGEWSASAPAPSLPRKEPLMSTE